MLIITIGFIVLIALQLMPLSHAIVSVIDYSNFLPPAAFPALKLLFSYLAATIAVVIFIKKSNFPARLPQPAPGKILMALGIFLYIAVPACLSVAVIAKINGKVIHFILVNSLQQYPSLACLFAGSIRVLMNLNLKGILPASISSGNKE